MTVTVMMKTTMIRMIKVIQTDDGWFEVDKDGSRNSLSRPSFGEERRTGVGRHGGCLVAANGQSIRLNAVL